MQKDEFTQTGIVVLYKSLPAFDEALLQEHLSKTLGELKVSADKVNNSLFLVEWQGGGFKLTCFNQAAPQEAFGAAVVTSVNKEETQSIINTHKAHIVITPLVPVDNVGSSIMQAMQLMRLAFVLRSGDKPLGYFWDCSEVLLGLEGFEKAVASLREAIKRQSERDPSAGSYLPIGFWVGQRFFNAEGQTQPNLISLGLRRFLGYEIQLPNLGDFSLMSESLERLVAYLFFQGGVVKDGDTLSAGDYEYSVSFAEQDKHLPRRLVLASLDDC